MACLQGQAFAETVSPPAELPPEQGPVTRLGEATMDVGTPASRRAIHMLAPLRDQGYIIGELPFSLRDTIEIEKADLLRLLRPLLSEQGYGALDTAMLGRGLITPEELRPHGYTLVFDRQTLQFDLTIPAGARAHTAIRLADGRNSIHGDFAEPARLSGYLNARASLNHVDNSASDTVDQVAALFDFATRYSGVVFETEGSYYNEMLRRDGSRFVVDDRERILRYTLGDLRPASRGFQIVPPMAGVQVMRSYSLLDPSRNLRANGRRTFTLARPSTIQAIVNGHTVRRFRLQPGSYNIEDLPFAQGANDVEIIAEDDVGGREVFAYSFYYERTLLERGQDEFAFNAGVESGFSADGRTYDSEEWVVSGAYRRGLTDRLSAGGNVLFQRGGHLIGGEVTLATPIGTIVVEVATSANDLLGNGYAYSGTLFDTVELRGDHLLSYAFAYETRSENMAPPSAMTVENRFSGEYGASITLGFPSRQHLLLNARYSQGRNGFSDEHSIRVGYGRALSQRLAMNAEVFQREHGGQDESGLRLELNFRLTDRSTVTGQYESADERVRLAYDTSRGEGIGSWSAGGEVETDEFTTAFNGSFSQTLNRARWGVSHTAAFADLSADNVTNATSLRLTSAIVFADGALALSRPVYDSFVLVSPHPSLRGAQVVIEPTDVSVAARSGVFGPAALPELSAFSPRTVTYDVPNAPLGYDIGAGAVRMLPAYRSGYLHVVGSEYSLSAIGRLVDSAGEPMRLVGGQAFEVAAPDRAPITVFTNRDGRFGAFGLRPGRWRVEMPAHLVYYFDMPENPTSMVQIGQLTPEPSP